MNRFQSVVHCSLFDEFPKFFHNRSFVSVRHGQVRAFPVGKHTEPFKFFALDIDKITCIIATQLTDFGFRRGFLFFLLFLAYLVFDRQTMTIPSRHKGRIIPFHPHEPDNEILKNLV